jgi:hypothetical protein
MMKIPRTALHTRVYNGMKETAIMGVIATTNNMVG